MSDSFVVEGNLILLLAVDGGFQDVSWMRAPGQFEPATHSRLTVGFLLLSGPQFLSFATADREQVQHQPLATIESSD